jgi:hypothetical protein
LGIGRHKQILDSRVEKEFEFFLVISCYGKERL